MAVILPPNSTGQTVDTNVVAAKERQIATLGDPTTAAAQATVAHYLATDANTYAGIYELLCASGLLLNNGATLDRAKSASAANLALAVAGVGAQMVAPVGMFSLNHTPAAATQATIGKAAGAGAIRNVCTSISCCVSTVGTAQTAALVFVLRDGATGAGTVLWSLQVSLPVSYTWSIALSGLCIVGSAATAMTLETVAAPAAAAFASVAWTGFQTT